MENTKLQQLTDKLYQEGLEKGRAEAESLVAEAEARAAKIVSEAEARAAKIAADAERKAEDVEKNVGISKDYNNWELLKAVISRDYPKCCAIIKYFRNNPKNNPTIVTGLVLFNYFAKLTVAHFLPSKDDSSLMVALEAKNAYSLNDYKTGLRTYSPAKAVNAIHHLREFDAKNKGIGSFGNEYNLLQELIFKIMT